MCDIITRDGGGGRQTTNILSSAQRYQHRAMAVPRENIPTSPAVLNCHFLHDEAVQKGGSVIPRPLNVDALEDVRVLGELSSDLALHGESL